MIRFIKKAAITHMTKKKNMISTRFNQLLIWLLGISSIFWAFFDPRFKNAEGFLEGSFCLPISIGVALFVLGYTYAGRLRRFGFWFALLLVGQAVELQLIEAGPHVRYQHFKPFGHLSTTNILFLFFLAIQTVLVVASLKKRLRAIKDWLFRNFKPWQITGILIVLMFTSATVSREIGNYIDELLLVIFIQIINVGNIILVVCAIPGDSFDRFQKSFGKYFEPFEKQDDGHHRVLDSFAISAAVWVTLLATTLCLFSYERHPHIPDEVGYIYHARYFSNGMLTMPAPPVKDAFDVDLMTYEKDRWYSPVPPGWPAMLAVGERYRIPWLVNPLLAGINMLLIYVLLIHIYDRRTARLVLLLLCFSPWYVFMGMNFLTHTFTLCCSLVAAIGVVYSRKTGKSLWALLGGGALGIVSLTRPLDGLILAGLLGLWAIGIGGRRLKVPSIAAFLTGTIIVGSLILPYNRLLTGSPTAFPLNAYFEKYYGPKSNALGFGPERGLGWAIDPFPGHSPLDAMVNANLNASSINTELFGWSTGSLILVALFVFSGLLQTGDYLMLATVFAVFVAYFFYYFSGGPDFGARYWYLMLLPCVSFTVRGIHFLGKSLQPEPAGSNHRHLLVLAAVLCLSACTFVNFFPWRAIDKYFHYRGMRPDIRYLSKEYEFGRSLVLISGNRAPDYASAAIYNPLDLHADGPIFAWNKNPDVLARIMKAYPDRRIWRVNGPSITHGGYEVVEEK